MFLGDSGYTVWMVPRDGLQRHPEQTWQMPRTLLIHPMSGSDLDPLA